MGLFSGKTKTHVGTSIVRVVEDKMLPNALMSGVLKSTLANGDLSTNLIRDMVNSLAITSDRYMEKGRSSRNPWGTPSGSMSAWTQGAAAVKERIEQLEGSPISLVYSRIGKPNYIHLGWMHLVSSYEYSFETNELRFLSRQYDYPVYLKDIKLHVPRDIATNLAEGTAEIWGVPPNAGKVPNVIEPKYANPNTNLTGLFGTRISLRKPSHMYVEDGITEPYLKVVYVVDKTTKYPLGRPVSTPFSR